MKILREKSTDKLGINKSKDEGGYHNIYATGENKPVGLNSMGSMGIIPTKKKEDLLKKIIRLDKKESTNSSIVILQNNVKSR
jgi:hypothetical protein